MGTVRNFMIRVWINLVSNMYPRGIQLGTSTMCPGWLPPKRHCYCYPAHTGTRKTSLNCEHIESFKCLALVCVICPEEKSNTSSESSLRMTMLFWQRLSLVLLAPIISGMKDSQFLGHSLFKIATKIRFNLLRYVFSFSIRSGDELVLIIRPTMYFLIPSHWFLGRTFHLVLMTDSRICRA